ncbi:MAG: helical backbone metal receptor, partial [Betaproteobacteria bacterium]
MGATIDDNGVEHLRVKSGARIVCVVPSITELLFDLGLGESVVGRTGFCFYPREKVKSVPKIGGTKDFDLQKLAELKATHLIVNIDENPKELVEAASAIVPNTIVTHPITPMDNIKLYELLGSIFCRDQEMK